MRRYCWSIVLVGMLSLAVFGCAVSSDAEPDDSSESGDPAEAGDPAVAENMDDSELSGTCPRWFCDSVHPSGCEGFGFGASIGRCRVEAWNDCNANCGPGCPLDDSPTCDSF